jgi:hypothetical protein
LSAYGGGEMASESGKQWDATEDQVSPRPDLSRYSLVVEGPWTEADEIWFECMTGEYDRRLLREIHEREAVESDL